MEMKLILLGLTLIIAVQGVTFSDGENDIPLARRQTLLGLLFGGGNRWDSRSRSDRNSPSRSERDSSESVEFFDNDLLEKQCRAKVDGKKLYRLSNQKVYYFGNMDLKTYMDAKSACESMGMHLATPETKFENALIRDLIDREPYILQADGYIWLGVNDLDADGVWKFSHNGGLLTFLDTDGVALTDGECLTFLRGPDNTFWESAACTEKYSYICEMEEPCNKYVDALYRPIASLR